MSNRDYWESVYQSKGPLRVSWYQQHAKRSAELIRRTGVNRPGFSRHLRASNLRPNRRCHDEQATLP